MSLRHELYFQNIDLANFSRRRATLRLHPTDFPKFFFPPHPAIQLVAAAGPSPHYRTEEDAQGSDVSLLAIAARKLGFDYAVETDPAVTRLQVNRETGQLEGFIASVSSRLAPNQCC